MSDALALAPAVAEHDFGSFRGVTMPKSAGGSGGFLSDVIVQLGFADPDAVELAVQEASRLGGTAEQLLLRRGAIDEERLARAIAERNGLPFVDLGEFEVDEAATHLIDRSMALRYQAIPIALAPDGSLLVALADPLNALAVSDLSVVTKSQVLAAVAVAAQIDALIDELPESSPHDVPDWTAGLDVGPSRSPVVESSWSPQPASHPPGDEASPERERAFERMPSSAPERLRERIGELVEELVADASHADVADLEAEAERLRAELLSERSKREALERERDEGEASRQSMARALEQTSADLERATLEADRLRTELAQVRADAKQASRPGSPSNI